MRRITYHQGNFCGGKGKASVIVPATCLKGITNWVAKPIGSGNNRGLYVACNPKDHPGNFPTHSVQETGPTLNPQIVKC